MIQNISAETHTVLVTFQERIERKNNLWSALALPHQSSQGCAILYILYIICIRITAVTAVSAIGTHREHSQSANMQARSRWQSRFPRVLYARDRTKIEHMAFHKEDPVVISNPLSSQRQSLEASCRGRSCCACSVSQTLEHNR